MRHEFVVVVLGVLAGDQRQANHRILVHPDEATGLADTTILLQMVEDSHRFVLGAVAPVPRRAGACGDTVLASGGCLETGGFGG